MLNRFRLNHKKNINTLCAITFLQGGVAITVASQEGNLPVLIKSCSFIPNHDESLQLKTLGHFLDHHGLRGVSGALVLQPQQYRLLYLNAPLVLEEELGKAARWMIKDLIQYPIEQAAVDIIPVPARPGQKKMYVVAAKLTELEALNQTLAHWVTLTAIAIPELALNRLLSLMPKVEQGIALLYMSEHRSAHLIINKGGILRLVRDVGDAYRQSAQGFEALTLEVQRSLDFYQSQFGEPMPAQVYVSPSLDSVGGPLIKALTEGLPLPVSEWDIRPHIPLLARTETSVIKACLPTIGQVLLSGEGETR